MMKKNLYYKEYVKKEVKISYVKLRDLRYFGVCEVTSSKRDWGKVKDLQVGDKTPEIFLSCNSLQGKFVYEVVEKGHFMDEVPTGEYKLEKYDSFWFEDWKESKNEEDRYILFCGNLTVFSEKGYIHDFPIRGNYVFSKKGKNLFFADEEKGKHVLSRQQSKARNRFHSDKFIEKSLMESGAVFATHDREWRYEVRKH